MVKAVQAEDALSEHFDGLLKDRVAAEVGQLCCLTCTPCQAAPNKHSCFLAMSACHVALFESKPQVGLLIGKPSVGSRDIVLAVVPNPDGDEVGG